MVAIIGTITGIVTIAGVVGKAIHWVYTTVNRADRTYQLVEHMYTNHLPHIDQSLRLICAKLGIEYEEPKPPPLV